MLLPPAVFEIDYEGSPATVREHYIGARRIFRIEFSDGRLPLVLTVAKNMQGKKFWAAIPDGRPAETEEIGKLIGIYFRSQK